MVSKEDRIGEKKRAEETSTTRTLRTQRLTSESLGRLGPEELKQQILILQSRLEKALEQLKTSRAEIEAYSTKNMELTNQLRREAERNRQIEVKLEATGGIREEFDRILREETEKRVELEARIENLLEERRKFDEQFSSLEGILEEKVAEVARLRRALSQAETASSPLEEKVAALEEELQRNREALEREAQRNEELSFEINLLKVERDDLAQRLTRSEADTGEIDADAPREDSGEHSHEITILYHQLSDLQEILAERERENEELWQEKERLRERVSELEAQTSEMTRRIEEAEAKETSVTQEEAERWRATQETLEGRIATLEEDLSEKERQLAGATESAEGLAAEKASLEGRIATLEEDLSGKERELAEVRKEVETLTGKKTALEGRIATLEEDLSEKEQRLAQLTEAQDQTQRELQKLEGERAQLEETSGRLQARLSEQTREIETLRRKLATLEEALAAEKAAHATLRETCEAMTRERDALAQEIERHQERETTAQREIAELEERVASVAGERDELEANLVRLNQEHQTLSEAYERIGTDLEAERSRLQEARAEIEALRTELAEKEQAFEKLRKERHEFAATIRSLDAKLSKTTKQRIALEHELAEARAQLEGFELLKGTPQEADTPHPLEARLEAEIAEHEKTRQALEAAQEELRTLKEAFPALAAQSQPSGEVDGEAATMVTPAERRIEALVRTIENLEQELSEQTRQRKALEERIEAELLAEKNAHRETQVILEAVREEAATLQDTVETLQKEVARAYLQAQRPRGMTLTPEKEWVIEFLREEMNTVEIESDEDLFRAVQAALNRLMRVESRMARYQLQIEDLEKELKAFREEMAHHEHHSVGARLLRSAGFRPRVITQESGGFSFQNVPLDLVVADMKADHEALWLAAERQGLWRFDPRSFTPFEIPLEMDQRAICQSLFVEGADLWIGTAQGLIRLHKETQAWERFLPEGDPEARDIRVIRRIGDRLWIGTWGGGVWTFDPKTETFESVALGVQFGAFRVAGIAPDDDCIWLALWGVGLVRYDPERGEGTLCHPDRGIEKETIQTVLATSEAIWFGSWGSGLGCLRKEEKTLTILGADAGLISNYVKTLAHHEGRLWIGTRNGVSCLDATAFLENEGADPRQFWTNFGKERNLVEVTSISVGPKETWIATKQNGLVRIRKM
ncbi:MAG: hypothetical protein D6795_09250 [Deltaproteobacteria bacterium]|nr:MAG: hypothetical protein D6795_09250 [Deltaproteobacteria bacterium]